MHTGFLAILGILVHRVSTTSCTHVYVHVHGHVHMHACIILARVNILEGCDPLLFIVFDSKQ